MINGFALVNKCNVQTFQEESELSVAEHFIIFGKINVYFNSKRYKVLIPHERHAELLFLLV